MTAIKSGISSGLSQWKIAFIVYILQSLFAITLGIQVYQVMEASIGNSLEINKLLLGYDNTVINDFLNTHGASITPLIGQLRWVILVYALFSIFINAGIINAIITKEKGWNAFWKGGATYFFSFLKVSLIILFFAAVWSAIILLPFMTFFPTSIEVFSSERTSVRLLFLVLFIWSLGLVFLFNWSLFAKKNIIVAKARIWPAIKYGFVFTARHYFSTTGLFILLLLFQILLFTAYWMWGGIAGMISPILVAGYIVVQQLVFFLRIIGRMVIYGGMLSMGLINMEVKQGNGMGAEFP